MTDLEQKALVERLRIIPDRNGLMYDEYDDVMKAADLIERLRIEAEAQYDRGYYDGCTHPLQAENERLREHLISALDTLKDAEVCDDNCGPCNEAHAALEQSK